MKIKSDWECQNHSEKFKDRREIAKVGISIESRDIHFIFYLQSD